MTTGCAGPSAVRDRPLHRPAEGDLLSGAALAALDGYQGFVSARWGRRCLYEPSCSAHAVEAVRRDGVVGIAASADRWMRCRPGGPDGQPRRTADGRVLDPPAPELPGRHGVSPLFSPRAPAPPLPRPRTAPSPLTARPAAPRDSPSAARAGAPRVLQSTGPATRAQDDPDTERLRDRITADEQWAFADALFDRGEWNRAWTEYERGVVLFPDDPGVGPARVRQVWCRHRDGDFEAAVRDFGRLAGADAEDRVRAAEAAAASLASLGLYGRAAGLLADAAADARAADRHALADRVDTLRALLHLEIGDTDAARLLLGERSDRAAERIRTACDTLDAAPSRSPRLASGLSAVVPGLGQAYAGRPGDGAVAFLTTGVFFGGGVVAIVLGQVAGGAVACVVGAYFWSGAVWGAAREAFEFNREQSLEVLAPLVRDLREQSGFTIGPAPGPSAGE